MKKKSLHKRMLISLMAIMGLAFTATGVSAQVTANSLPLERYRVAIDDTGMGTTEGGGIPAHMEYQLGLIGNYTLNPLGLRNKNDKVFEPIVAHRLAANMIGTIGLFDWVSIGADLPLTFLQLPGSNTDLMTKLGISTGESVVGIGDLKIVPKLRLLREDEHFVSLAFIPAFTLPTASGFSGDGSFTYGTGYLGENTGSFSFLPELALSTNMMGVRLATNLQWRIRKEVNYFGLFPVQRDLSYKFALGYDIAWALKNLMDVNYPDFLLVYAELFGATPDSNPFGLLGDGENAAQTSLGQNVNNALEWSVGTRMHVWEGVHLEAALGSGILSGYGTPDFRFVGGIRYAPHAKDSDGDGINDSDDACVDVAEDMDGIMDSDGCPETDADGDGIEDASDKCPVEAEDMDQFEDEDGCADNDNDKDGIADSDDKCPDATGPVQTNGCPLSDKDQDGIGDADDKCPEEKGPASRDGCPMKDTDKDGIEDSKDKCPENAGPVEREGCPLNDRDLDGVLDSDDKCPDEKGPATRDGCPIPDKDGDGIEDKDDKCPEAAGPKMLMGCPDKDGDGIADGDDKCPDSPGPAQFQGCGDKDHDGIPDNKDKCPEKPETINGVKDTDGCPDKGKVLVTVTKDHIEIKKKVFFKSGRSKIRRKSFSLLNQVSQILRANSEIAHIEIQGHTDSRGKDSKNKKLSQKRAEAVKAYLVDHGVAADRLKPVGYGEEQPIADNKKKSGRADNRRVEFVIKGIEK